MITDPRWLDADQQRHWRAYLRGSALLQEAFARDLQCAADLSLPEYEVLVWLSEAPGRRLRMSALADHLVHSRSRLTHTIKRLERRGLVHRLPAETDGRGIDCLLTDTGFELLDGVAPLHVASVRRYLVDVLTDGQLRTLGESFAAVADAIDAAGGLGSDTGSARVAG